MPRTTQARTSDGCSDGWDALAQGRWDAARKAFELSVAAEPTPRGFEGLSWTAWWLDDAAQVFSAREHAYRLYVAQADALGAGRMATWLACDQLDFYGAGAVANGWLEVAHRLLDSLEPAREHGWLSFVEGYVAHGRGDTARSMQLAHATAELGRRLGASDLEMLGLALDGACLVSCARVADGMRRLDEATVVALQREAEIPIASAWACCFMVTACTAVRDYERAAEWCDRIAEFAERYGSRYILAFCRAEYGAVHLWRGRWSDAEVVLEASVEDFSRSRPAMIGQALAMLGELRRRQGRSDEATRLLDGAGPGVAGRLCRARLALDAGDAAQAAELADRILRQLPEDRALARAPALELLVRACVAAAEVERAVGPAAALREVARRVGTVPLLAAADLVDGIVAAASGDHATARPLLEDAVDGFDRSGGSFEAAEARIELASTLHALGRADAAHREAGAAISSLAELGAVAAAERARRMAGAPAELDPLPEVTPREREVLRLVAHGLTNQEIAAELHLSQHTVHRHVTNILRKLGLASRTAAAARAARSGLLDATLE